MTDDGWDTCLRCGTATRVLDLPPLRGVSLCLRCIARACLQDAPPPGSMLRAIQAAGTRPR